LLDLEDEVDPDLVHINGYAHAALPWRAPVLVVAHSCVVSWWEAVRRCPPPPSWEEYRRRVQAGLGNAAQVVAPTAAMLAALDRAYGVRGGTVVPNGRRCDAVGPGAKQRFVLSAGRLWDEAKNVAALDRIAPSVDGRVVIAGDATSPDGRTWAGGGADLLGSLPFGELAGWMQDAAVFALPARYEPFGLAALEAGLAGCALVLGDIPSLREVWADSALFVDPEDDLELQRAIQHLLDHPRPRRRMAAAARERASGYSLDRMARGYRSVYASLQPLATGVVAS
jgi:glycosyltransferase involved in cell wall biosynthesis